MGIVAITVLLLAPFVAIRDYFGKIAPLLDPRSGALMNASHDAGMLGLASCSASGGAIAIGAAFFVNGGEAFCT